MEVYVVKYQAFYTDSTEGKVEIIGCYDSFEKAKSSAREEIEAIADGIRENENVDDVEICEQANGIYCCDSEGSIYDVQIIPVTLE